VSGLSGERAPDYHEPLVGWRVWLLEEEKIGLHLRSVVHEIIWPPRTELVALCLQRSEWRHQAHTAPAAECECGIYSTHDPGTLDHYLGLASRWRRRKLDRVLGLVYLWGRVLTCERGWRASEAYPARLYIPVSRGVPEAAAHEAAHALASAYRVPVEVLELPRGVSAVEALGQQRHAA
jgi:hypothetical protein